MAEKICTKCGLSKPLEAFYKHKHTKDGRGSWCVECAIKQNRSPRALRLARERKQRRQRENPRYFTERQRVYRKKYPEKIKARELVKKAVSDGSLIRMPCEVCGEPLQRAEAHHNDYSEPTAVEWLCPEHHAKVHRKHG